MSYLPYFNLQKGDHCNGIYVYIYTVCMYAKAYTSTLFTENAVFDNFQFKLSKLWIYQVLFQQLVTNIAYKRFNITSWIPWQCHAKSAKQNWIFFCNLGYFLSFTWKRMLYATYHQLENTVILQQGWTLADPFSHIKHPRRPSESLN